MTYLTQLGSTSVPGREHPFQRLRVNVGLRSRAAAQRRWCEYMLWVVKRHSSELWESPRQTRVADLDRGISNAGFRPEGSIRGNIIRWDSLFFNLQYVAFLNPDVVPFLDSINILGIQKSAEAFVKL